MTTAPATPDAAPTMPDQGGVSQDAARSASNHAEKGASQGLPLIFWLLEQRLVTLLAIATLIALLVTVVL
ncbi:MAG: hypothetical protein JRJ80_14895, partial [Deltaproteobacteria bacterium]|nr:hypothetical protein [Deltaproteobacteria bacterium]MBW2215457.1 hypothetical protein [Deltaproteobacteria bacterium]MBW2379682.1 hypothetical protein [Deltaproteobacteria bacterium]